MPVIRKEISDHQFIVERDSAAAFPNVGKANTLYVDKGSGIIYRFDTTNIIYVTVGDNWKKIKEINGGAANSTYEEV